MYTDINMVEIFCYSTQSLVREIIDIEYKILRRKASLYRARLRMGVYSVAVRAWYRFVVGDA